MFSISNQNSSARLQKMKPNPRNIRTNIIFPFLSSLGPASVSFYCLFIFYTEVAGKDLMHFAYMGYLSVFASALAGFTGFVQDESFLDLRVLLDYTQLVLPMTCLTTEIWQKYEMAPMEICVLPAAFGIAAVLFFIVVEYKRQDITDLTLILSMAAMFVAGIVNENYYACAAASFFAGTYFGFKRREDCCLNKQAAFNYSMGVFSTLTLAAFEPQNFLPQLTEA